MRRIIGMRRLTDDNGVVHAHHNGTIDTAVEHTTACGIRFFAAYELPREGPESSLKNRFQVVRLDLKEPSMLIGTFEVIEVSCMTCLVRMQSWNP